jgi:hypothetical protein
MFDQWIFNLVCFLVFSRWARGYEEHHGACEEACTARIGPIYLEINRCFVLDHDDAFISLRIPTCGAPTLRGRLEVGYVACLGQDEIRRPGFYQHWHRPRPKARPGQSRYKPGEPFPF